MEEMLLKSLLSNGIGGATGQLPVLLLMWLMLKELRAWMPKVDKRLETLEATHIASAKTANDVAHLNARLDEHKKDTKDERREDRDRLALIESELKAVWRKIGDRPGDRSA